MLGRVLIPVAIVASLRNFSVDSVQVLAEVLMPDKHLRQPLHEPTSPLARPIGEIGLDET